MAGPPKLSKCTRTFRTSVCAWNICNWNAYAVLAPLLLILCIISLFERVIILISGLVDTARHSYYIYKLNSLRSRNREGKSDVCISDRISVDRREEGRKEGRKRGGVARSLLLAYYFICSLARAMIARGSDRARCFPFSSAQILEFPV